jgi:hypothetical protein
MSNLTRAMMMGAAGASGDPVYVDDVFSTYVYEGTSSAQTITNGIDLAGEGGLVWTKCRELFSGIGLSHALIDTERGVTNVLKSDLTDANQVRSATITQFNNDGYLLGGNDVLLNYQTGLNYASWTFRKAPGFFDIQTWTGTAATRTIPHNLGSVPGMIIAKRTDGAGQWYVYHRELANTQYIMLNSSNGEDTGAIWGNTTPTSTEFTVGTGQPNEGNQNYVAYIFAHDDASFGTGGNESIIKCGGFTATNTWGNFKVDLGFEPQFVLMKKTSATGNWIMLDSMRGITGPGDYPLSDTSTFFSALQASDDAELEANNSSAESTQGRASLYSQGFLGTTGAGGGVEYIYMAIRRPHKPPEAATEVFAVSTGNGSNTIPAFVSNFTVDAAFLFNFGGGYDPYLLSRLTGETYLRTNTYEAQVTNTGETYDSNTGWARIYNSTYQSVMFKRAPGFMDVVAYSGFGSNSSTFGNISHNLNVAPQLILVKSRDDVSSLGGAGGWHVYHSGVNKEFNYLNTNASGGSPYFITASTSTTFTVRDHPNTGYTGYNYVAYLFATLPGISKVGSYSGNTGYAVNVDCGFIAGARFILIKRSDSPGDWYLWDSLRGIVSGNDPYLLLNVNTTQTTNTDYIDPLGTGFTVTASAPAALNLTGGTYIFLAIA